MLVWKMSLILVGACWLSLVETGVVLGDEIDKYKKGLDIISEFADRICGDEPLQGSSSKLELSGKAKADVPGLIKKLADIGIEGAAKYQRSEYQGVLQSDLAKALKDRSNCKLKVLETVKPRLLPEKKAIDGGAGSGTENIRRKGGEKDRPKLPPTTSELEGILREQLTFLCLSCQYFDQGLESEGKRIATALHILFVGSEESLSLLEQMRIRDEIRIPNSGYRDTKGNLMPYHGLVGLHIGGKRRSPYEALCLFPPDLNRPQPAIPFNEWFQTVVLDDRRGVTYTRGSLIIAVAEQDGGIRVASGLDPKYVKLARKEGIGWMSGNKPILGIELHTIRQIAWEVMEAFTKQYPQYVCR